MRYLLFCILALISVYSFSQDFEWVKTFGSTGSETGYSSVLSKDGKYEYITGTFNASINFGTFSFLETNGNNNLYIVKMDKNGKVINTKNFRSSKNALGHPYSITIDSFENIFITGRFQDTLNFNPTNKIIGSPGKTNYFLVKLDSGLNYQWVKQGFGNPSDAIGRGVATDKNNNCYAVVNINKNSTFTTESITYSNSGNFLIKYAPNGTLQWVKPLNDANSNMFVNNMKYYNSNLYVLGSLDSILIGATKYKASNTSYRNAFSLIVDTGGVPQNIILAGNNCEYSVAFDISYGANGSYYLTGNYNGKAQFGSFILKQNQTTGTLPFFAHYDKNNNCLWVKSFSTDATSSTSAQCFSIDNYKNNFIYVTGDMGGDAGFDNFKTVRAEGPVFIAKIDSNGNFIWAQRCSSAKYFSVAHSLNVDTSGSCYLLGEFIDTLMLKNDTIKSNGYQDVFFTKINDIGIYLDSIKPTMYCSGDSIKIPYRSYGDFDTANYISVLLSDSAGKFDSIFYTLRTVKLKPTDTIACKLPDILFGSSHYKIKVFTTVNHVSSFDNNIYYTIYIKPKITASNDTAICSPAAIQLKASVNTNSTWLWKPGATLSDSTISNPVANPMITTTYIVTATNALGCIGKDTVTINIVKKPSVKINNDTTICKNSSVFLHATRLNNDSISYFKWMDTSNIVLSTDDTFTLFPKFTTKYRLVTANSIGCTDTQSVKISLFGTPLITPLLNFVVCRGSFILLQAKGNGGDTASYNFRLYKSGILQQQKHDGIFIFTIDSTSLYSVILADFCSLNDTAKFTITVRDSLKLKLNIKDTTLCLPATIMLQAKGNGGDTASYSFSLLKSGILLQSNHSGVFTFPANATANYSIILSDACALNDTNDFTITIHDSLKLKLNLTDTILCLPRSISFTATGIGGDTASYNFRLYKSGTLLQSNHSGVFTFIPNATSNYSVILSDVCATNDSAKFTITVRDPLKLKLNIKDTTLCLPGSITLQATGTGGDSISYNFSFYKSGILLQSNKNGVFNFLADSTASYVLILSDVCLFNDTVKFIISVRNAIKLKLSTTDTTICKGAPLNIRATATGGNGSFVYSLLSSSSQLITSNATGNFDIPTDSDRNYIITISDICSTKNDSLTIKVKIISGNTKDTVNILYTTVLNSVTTYTIWNKLPNVISYAIRNNTITDTFFTHHKALPSAQSEKYYVTANDICGNKSVTSKVAQTIYLQAESNAAEDYAILTYTPYETWKQGVLNYDIEYLNVRIQQWIKLTSVNGNTLSTNAEILPNSGGFNAVTIKQCYRIVAHEQNGNAQQSISNEACVSVYPVVFLPNAFSPNGDGLNDYYKPVCSGFSYYLFEIYDRWGQLIYKDTPESKGWDGTFKEQPLPPGIYVYKMSAQAILRNKFTNPAGAVSKGGTIMLLR